MTKIFNRRMTVDLEDDFVVFLIGLRINNFWNINQWFPVMSAMPKMLKELYKNPELGFISNESWFGRTTIMVQYWRSYEDLENYAKDKTSNHLPAWANFNKKIAANGAVGIWHETFVINKGNYEAVYNQMPKFGLAKVGNHVSVTGKSDTAQKRLQKNT